MLQSNTWNHSTVCKKMSLSLFKKVINKMCLQIKYIFNIYMYEEDLALNNLQWLICLKVKPNQTNQVNRTCLNILTDLNLILIPLVFFPSLWGLFQVHQLQLVSPSHSYSTAFSVHLQNPHICISFHFLLFLLYGPLTAKSTWWQVLFFLINQYKV